MDQDMQQYLDKAEVLIEALTYIQRFNRKIIVVKYGGSAMLDEELQKNVIKDVTFLKLVGFKPIIVHGGGKEISKWVSKAGMEPKFIDGVRAIGVSGKDGGLLRVDKKLSMTGQDVGFVGDIKKVNAEVLLDLLDKDFLPIVCPVGIDDDYNTYNINADDAAYSIAKAVHAEKLAFLSDIEGVYRDYEDKSSLITALTVDQANELIESGAISGGMIPKLQNCVGAIENGVSRVHILDGRIPHCLLLEIFTKKGIGTAILRNGEED